MSKISKLEKQWMRYKTKKIVSVLLFLSMFYAVSAGGYYTFLNWNSINSFFYKKSVLEDVNVSQANKDDNKSLKAELIENKSIKIEEQNTTEVVKELYFTPIIPIIDMEKERAKSSRVVVHKEKKHSNRVKAKPSTYLTAKELSKVTANKSEDRDTTRLKKIHLQSSSQNYIETMKKKFQKGKSPRDALLLAKEFYRMKRYKQSEKWALEANKIDSNLQESWILFAQAKAKMGKRNEAIKILEMYYKKNKLPKVKAIIEKIKIGKI